MEMNSIFNRVYIFCLGIFLLFAGYYCVQNSLKFEHIQLISLIYLILSSISFVMFGLDKFLAIKQLSRIPNKILLASVYLGGVFGGLLGLILFRHKTQKWYYTLSIQMMLIIHIALFIYLCN